MTAMAGNHRGAGQAGYLSGLVFAASRSRAPGSCPVLTSTFLDKFHRLVIIF